MSIAALCLRASGTALSKSNSAFDASGDLLHLPAAGAGGGGGGAAAAAAGPAGAARGAAAGFGTRSGSHCSIAMARRPVPGAVAQVAGQSLGAVVDAALTTLLVRRCGADSTYPQLPGSQPARPGTYPSDRHLRGQRYRRRPPRAAPTRHRRRDVESLFHPFGFGFEQVFANGQIRGLLMVDSCSTILTRRMLYLRSEL